jgi:hypothetical protein
MNGVDLVCGTPIFVSAASRPPPPSSLSVFSFCILTHTCFLLGCETLYWSLRFDSGFSVARMDCTATCATVECRDRRDRRRAAEEPLRRRRLPRHESANDAETDERTTHEARVLRELRRAACGNRRHIIERHEIDRTKTKASRRRSSSRFRCDYCYNFVVVDFLVLQREQIAHRADVTMPTYPTGFDRGSYGVCIDTVFCIIDCCFVTINYYSLGNNNKRTNDRLICDVDSIRRRSHTQFAYCSSKIGRMFFDKKINT